MNDLIGMNFIEYFGLQIISGEIYCIIHRRFINIYYFIFYEIYCPRICLYLSICDSYIPIKIVPPERFRNEQIVRFMLYEQQLSYGYLQFLYYKVGVQGYRICQDQKKYGRQHKGNDGGEGYGEEGHGGCVCQDVFFGSDYLLSYFLIDSGDCFLKII